MVELAIPLVALGGLYIVSKFEKKDEEKENYQNLNKMKIESAYPTKQAVTSKNNVNYYPNPNQATDKYFDQANYQKISSQNSSDRGVGNNNSVNINSLTGNDINKNNFQHNNMVPFFGSKVKGCGPDFNTGEGILDNMQGLGSQQFKKQEVAPLFKPEKGMQFAHGAPDNTEFFQSRQISSMKMSNVTPWDQIQVGPGLNSGYGTNGQGGFNAGMEARQEWMPKTVDELRVATNPKLTFGLDGHQGPALAPVVSRGIEGKMEKNLPDTYYTVGPDRWFTTTGAEKAQTARGIEIMQDQNRQCTTGEYFGNATDGDATYIKGNYEAAKRSVLDPNATMAAHAPSQNAAADTDYGVKGYKALPNHRSTTQNTLELSHAYGIGKAVIAPLLDFLRPTRKENVVGNARLNGNVNNNSGGAYVYDANDRTKITNRQMTGDRIDMNHLNVDAAQASDAYLVSKQQATSGQRDTTNYKYMGAVGGGANAEGDTSYAAAYNQRNNVNKQQNNVINPGGTQMFNQYTNISTMPSDCQTNPRMWVPNGGPTTISSKENYGGLNTMQSLSEQTNRSRMQPDILTAFKQNPYTQSLQSFA